MVWWWLKKGNIMKFIYKPDHMPSPTLVLEVEDPTVPDFEIGVDSREHAVKLALEAARKTYSVNSNTQLEVSEFNPCNGHYHFAITVRKENKRMESYTKEITTLLEQHKTEILERLATGRTLKDVKAYAEHAISTSPLPSTPGMTREENYLMRTRKEDASLIRAHVEKMLTVTLLERRAKLFADAADEIRYGNYATPRDAATSLIRNAAEDMDIDFFDTLSVYDYDTYDNYSKLDEWARGAVFETAWENVFGLLESERYENGVKE